MFMMGDKNPIPTGSRDAVDMGTPVTPLSVSGVHNAGLNII